MRSPWSRSRRPSPPPLTTEREEPDPPRVLGGRERTMGWVDDDWISPAVREYFPHELFPRLSPYFEHTEHAIFVEARPYAELVRRFPDEAPLYEIGNIWGMCYSAACVKGEEGHHHLGMLLPISPDRFRAAQAARWDL